MHSPGVKISAAAHAALILWLLIGPGFEAEPLPFEVTPVSIVSGEEYAQIVEAAAPSANAVTPDEAAAEPAPTGLTTPLPAEPAPVETPPVPVEEVAPVVEPPVDVAAPEEPLTDTPQPEAADRIASEAVAAPPEDVPVADTPTEAVAEDQPSEIVTEQPQEAAAPPETATQIVTEAQKPSGNLQTSVRPPARPAPPPPEVPAETPVETATPPDPALAETAPATETAAVDDAVAAALAAATTASQTPTRGPSGPPLSASTIDGFRSEVGGCWINDPGSMASQVVLTVSFAMTRDGHVDGDVTLQSASGGDSAAQQAAFRTARSAIFRCQNQGRNGYSLPADKYEQWQYMEVTFDPSWMRLR